MKITVTKVIRELEKKYGWANLKTGENDWFVKELIKDTINVINDDLLRLKNISIKGEK